MKTDARSCRSKNMSGAQECVRTGPTLLPSSVRSKTINTQPSKMSESLEHMIFLGPH